MVHAWWVWVGAGLALAALELLAPGYIFLGFAVGAVATGLVLAAGAEPALPWLLVIFALVSLGAWIALRKMVGVRKGRHRLWTRDINED